MHFFICLQHLYKGQRSVDLMTVKYSSNTVGIMALMQVKVQCVIKLTEFRFMAYVQRNF
jgi:hypothetical protein